jgi:predicted nucleic acid-binding protein
MNKALIDSDVILDFFFDREPFSKNAAKIIGLCESNQISGYVTPVICSNVYYLLRQVAKHQKVITQLTQLLTIVKILTMNEEIVLNSLNSEFKDFEDALQHYSAVSHSEIDLIITRNHKDYKHSLLPVMVPETFLKTQALS